MSPSALGIHGLLKSIFRWLLITIAAVALGHFGVAIKEL
ncbi:Hypothetical protein I595_1603 [Croceitalea dokdonensis DOKDO 023]|uniref:Uncharacterized protein n=1 Tax=Croceitalea dokdonensis DOKDO 023 TaxID=1300341 RepID=A0A0P7AVI9_9FLAO|nr:Hypothetical protein I595_1603 [Croceitalea dokdonensis DOKDO 023]